MKNDMDLLTYLGLEEKRFAPNSYYWRSPDVFLSKISSEDYLEPVVYFRHTNGDVLEKVLRISDGQSGKEMVLAMRADDPVERISSAFVNDSIFRQYRTSSQTVADEQELMAYAIDSAVVDYRYDRHLNFTEIKREKFACRTEHYTKDNQRAVEKRIASGKPFVLNGIAVHWKSTATYVFNGNERQRFPDVEFVLLNDKQKPVLVTAYPSMDAYAAFGFPMGHDFIDVNLDGFVDYKSYDPIASGSSGAFENVFLFNPAQKKFESAPQFSGYDLFVDPANRTVSSYGKSGFYQFGIRQIHLDKKSKIRFVDVFRCDEKNGILILSYERRKGKKVLAQKVKKIPMVSAETREEIEAQLLDLRK
ncbi:XAC2610-related protein [Flavobacterium sp.]|uniref:XAC2610-related protein n=1 Tax=Flavobacterium sp. TaxID=239 RepID=UPI0039E23555